ncbi:MAG: hypothetical protein FWH19_06280 [Treponema sp.]|nr:hypothetical protein [Treponema sp.]
MPRTWSFFLIFLLLIPGLNLSAQEEDEEPDQLPIESEWYDFYAAPYTRGDRTFNISLGLVMPTVFGGIDDNRHGLSMGGTGSLAFNYFLGPNIFLGGEFGGMFAGTRRGNMLYIVPFGLKAGYQFINGRFEFPVSFLVGAAPQRYIEHGYFGLFIKPGASVFWRYNPDWSFGLNTNWWLVPQWPANGNNAFGNFLELSLSARFHF